MQSTREFTSFCAEGSIQQNMISSAKRCADGGLQLPFHRRCIGQKNGARKELRRLSESGHKLSRRHNRVQWEAVVHSSAHKPVAEEDLRQLRLWSECHVVIFVER